MSRDASVPETVRHAQVLVMATIMAAWEVLATQGADAYDGCAFISGADVEAVAGEKLERRPRVVRRHGDGYRDVRLPLQERKLHRRSTPRNGPLERSVDMYLTALGATPRRNQASTMTAVSGNGDRAWWGPVNPTNGMLHIVRGTDIFWVQTYGKAAGAGSLEKTRATAAKAFAQSETARKQERQRRRAQPHKAGRWSAKCFGRCTSLRQHHYSEDQKDRCCGHTRGVRTLADGPERVPYAIDQLHHAPA